MGILLDWLRRRRARPTRLADAATRPEATAARAAEADSPNQPATEFGPIAQALGIDDPSGAAAPALDADLLEAARRVREHFQKNPQGPASAPSLSLRILNLVASPETDINELSRLISADPALSAGVLTVANSAAYSAVREIETVREAIARLGFEEVARVAGAVSAKSLFSPKLKTEMQTFGARFAALYHRSLTIATGAAWVAMHHRGRSDRAFLGGMLHDVGVAIALRSVAALSLDEKLSLGARDSRLALTLDEVHVGIGSAVHLDWSLPQYLIDVATRHHDTAVPAGEDFTDLHAVRLVNAIYELREESSPFAGRAAAELLQSARALRMSPLAVRAAASELTDISKRVARTFAVEAGRAAK